jgi:hypothetical protein
VHGELQIRERLLEGSRPWLEFVPSHGNASSFLTVARHTWEFATNDRPRPAPRVQERVLRQIRMLLAMRRELELETG